MSGLKLVSALQAAEADMKRSGSNALAARDGSRCYREYAFHRDHVRKAKSPRDLVQIAAKDLVRGQSSGKKWTRVLYTALERLKVAAEL